MKIVLDTNSLIQSVPRQSPFPYVDVITLAEFAGKFIH